MKRPSKELKRISRDILNNRYNVPMGAFVTASLITAVIEIPFSLSTGNPPSSPQLIIFLLAEYMIALISFVLGAGVIRVHLNMTRNYTYKISDVLCPFREGAERFFGAAFLMSLISIVCGIPAIAGSLYFYYSEITPTTVVILILAVLLSMLLFLYPALTYQFVCYFLLDYPQMKALAAFKECRLMMHKNKGRLFYILLSFIGFSLLIICSLGIASLWACPYMTQTFTIFYLDCTGELDRIPVRDYHSSPTGSQSPLR